MELKFWAWHKEHERYYLVTSLFIDYTGEETTYNLLDDRKGSLDVLHVGQDEVIIEQYTGLRGFKDGKIVKIFENDIISYKDNEYVVRRNKWFGGYFLFNVDTTINDRFLYLQDIKYEIERNGLCLHFKVLGSRREREREEHYEKR